MKRYSFAVSDFSEGGDEKKGGLLAKPTNIVLTDRPTLTSRLFSYAYKTHAGGPELTFGTAQLSSDGQRATIFGRQSARQQLNPKKEK